MARLFHRFDGAEKAPVLVLSNSLGTALEMTRERPDGFMKALVTA